MKLVVTRTLPYPHSNILYIWICDKACAMVCHAELMCVCVHNEMTSFILLKIKIHRKLCERLLCRKTMNRWFSLPLSPFLFFVCRALYFLWAFARFGINCVVIVAYYVTEYVLLHLFSIHKLYAQIYINILEIRSDKCYACGIPMLWDILQDEMVVVAYILCRTANNKRQAQVE